jgi:acyl carrier protein
MNDSLNRLVCEVVARHLQLEPRAIDAQKTVQEDLELDPLDLVLIALRIEELERIEFPIARLEYVRTVGDIVKIVRAAHAGDAEAPASPDSGVRLQNTDAVLPSERGSRLRSA